MASASRTRSARSSRVPILNRSRGSRTSCPTFQVGSRVDLYTIDNLVSFPGTPMVIVHIESRPVGLAGTTTVAPMVRSGDDTVTA